MLKDQLDRILPRVQKPARYIGGEQNSIVKDVAEVDVRFAFCFPDTYEIGMSHLGMKILYTVLNKMDGVWCERVFAPWLDFEEEMRKQTIPLYGLESLEPIRDFDFVGFTLQYELSFTNILNMLDLAGIPVKACDRDDSFPIVIAGGPAACNPEPVSDFIDLFSMGEGEENLPELIALYRQVRDEGGGKREFLRRAAQIEGVYVPSFYKVSYHEDGTIASVTPHEGAPEKVRKRIIQELDQVIYPESFVVPFIDIVHDRAMVEVMRGCIRGCRFCQAGFIYRPLREKGPDTLCRQGQDLCASTGYDEISLTSLSTSDYSQLEPMLEEMLSYTETEHVNLSLPSLRVDNFSEELLEKISRERKSGLTFAPEAGTQRLRDAINKNVTEEEVMRTTRIAFEGGYTAVKLYFMLGLPTETDEDVAGIIELAQQIVDSFYKLENRPKGKGVTVSVSVSTFVPKPFTPFQWEPQDTLEEIEHKQKILTDTIRSKKISCHWHESQTSVLEAVFARGDRRLGEVMYRAWRAGCKFDSWSECFHFDRWLQAMDECGLDMAFYANRRRKEEEILPWDHIDFGISKSFLWRENQRAHEGVTTPNCREKCSGCGANRLKMGGKCFA